MLCNEFDPDRKALIDPQEQFRPIAGFPEICVMEMCIRDSSCSTE